jgi:hypothetical protein
MAAEPVQNTGQNNVPAPIRIAREAVDILAAENPVLAEEISGILPAYAMKLHKSGVEVSVDLLADAGRQGVDFLKAQRTPQKKELTYNGILLERDIRRHNGTLDRLGEGVLTPDVRAAYVCLAILMNNRSLAQELYDDEKESTGINLYRTMYYLWFAAKFGRNEIFQDMFGDVSAKDLRHYSTKDAQYFLSEALVSSLSEAIRYGHISLADGIMEEIKSVTGAYDEGGVRSILMQLATTGDTDLFMKYAATTNSTNGSEALNEAIRNHFFDIADACVTAGWEIDLQGLLPQMAEEENTLALEYLRKKSGESAYQSWARYDDTDPHRAEWKRVAHCVPPRGLDKTFSPHLYRPLAYAEVTKMLHKEGYISSQYAYTTSAVFGTAQRVLEYMDKWIAIDSSQPLHNLISRMNLPANPPQSLTAWADAIIKCGPDMAALLKFCDKVPEPEKNGDGTWSLNKTRAAVALFAYDRGSENTALSKVFFEYNMTEEEYNKALDLAPVTAPEKTIPDITIEGEKFGLPGAVFHRLPVNDPYGLLLGEIVDCCQSIGGVGEKCAVHGHTRADSGFYVVRDADSSIIGETWAWTGKKGTLCFDSLETLGARITDTQWISLIKAFGDELTQKKNIRTIKRLNIGTGGGTPSHVAAVFNRAAECDKPVGYTGYRDSKEQVCAWERQSNHRRHGVKKG